MEQEGLRGAACLPVTLQDHQDQYVALHTEEEVEAIGHGHEHGLEGGEQGPLDGEADVVFLYGGLRTVIVAP